MQSKNAFMKKVLAVALTSCVTIGGLGIAIPNSTVYAKDDLSTVTVEEDSMSNEYIKLVTDENGRFVLGTTGGDLSKDTDNNKKLLYGFPDYVETSFTTIRIDGKSYIYGENGLETSPTFNADEKSCVSTQIINNIEITQTLSFVNNVSTDKEDVMEIKYVVKNNDSISHNIGTRIMLDTMLGNNDDAPFRVQGTGSVTTETEFMGDDIPQYWQAFDSLTEPTVVSQGTFVRGNDLKPDKVQFAHWGAGGWFGTPGVAETPWDYQITDGKSNDDSAVTVTWNETELTSGESRTYKTYYGLSELTQDNTPPLALSVYSDNTAVPYYSLEKLKYVFEAISITAYIENISDVQAKNAYLRIELPEGMNLVQTPDGQIYPNYNQAEFRYEVLDVEDIKQHSWTIQISDDIVAGTYSIKVVCGADDMEEKTIQRFINIPERENVQDNRIRWGEEKKNWGKPTGEWTGMDNLGFINSHPYFDREGYDKQTYRISDHYFNLLTKNMSNTVYNYLQKQRTNEWDGSCYGMSDVVSLMRTGYLHPSYWESNVSMTHSLSDPNKSENVESLISFYHLSQYLPDIQDIESNYDAIWESDTLKSDDSSVLKNVVSEAQRVKNGGMPVQLTFFWYKYVHENEKNNPIKLSNQTSIDDYKKLIADDSWMNNKGITKEFKSKNIILEDDCVYILINGKKCKVDMLDEDTLMLDEGEKININGEVLKLVNTYQRVSGVGHAVIAYDVDGPETAENGKTYRYRVSICDPNASKWTYLYISEDYSDWYYLNMSLTSEKNATHNVATDANGVEQKVMVMANSDIGTLDIVNAETGEDRSVLKNYNQNFISSYQTSVADITSSSNKKAQINGFSSEGDLDIVVLPSLSETADGTGNEFNRFILPDNNEDSYTITPQMENGIIDSTGTFINYMVGAKTSSGKSATFDPKGKVSLEGNNSDYQLEATYNDNLSNLPWFTLIVNGNSANNSSLEVVSDGMILTSDNLKDVKTTANNRNNEVSLNFSTDKDSVKFMAVDNGTLGAYIDNDGDGVYETLISDSNGGSDEPSDDPSDEPSDNPSSQPSDEPSNDPSSQPSDEPSNDPSVEPSNNPTINPNNNSPATGDSNPAIFMVVLFVVSSSAMVFCLRYRKRKTK